MIFDGLFDAVGGAIEGLLSRFGPWEYDLPIVSALARIAEQLAELWVLLPPLETMLMVIAAGLAVEALLIGFYMVNWLIKKIPFIG